MLPRLPSRLLSALLPAACALCGMRSDAMLCAPCCAQFFGPGKARCMRCANPLPDQARTCCGHCLSHPPAFDATLVAADYAAPIDRLVLQLKFGGQLALATLFAQLLCQKVRERPDFVLPTLLCPVPLGSHRLAERGFNQALEIARPLAKSLKIALYPLLAARVRDTPPQTRVAPAGRQRNVERAFALVPDAAPLVRGHHIGIVDDVITSGQTLSALAATFKRFGAARVTNLVFARTPPR